MKTFEKSKKKKKKKRRKNGQTKPKLQNQEILNK